jgi:hypothetical protein
VRVDTEKGRLQALFLTGLQLGRGLSTAETAGAETLTFRILGGVKNDRCRREREGEKGSSCDFK